MDHMIMDRFLSSLSRQCTSWSQRAFPSLSGPGPGPLSPQFGGVLGGGLFSHPAGWQDKEMGKG